MSEDVKDEDREWTWRDIEPYVGYRLTIPHGPGSSSLGSERVRSRDRWHALWVGKLRREVVKFHSSCRVVGPLGSEDQMGLQWWYVIVWAEVSGEDVWTLREDLEEGGYHVSSISISYEPAMA